MRNCAEIINYLMLGWSPSKADELALGTDPVIDESLQKAKSIQQTMLFAFFS